MEYDLEELLTLEEDSAIQELSNAITIDVNTRLPRLMRRLRLKDVLDIFEIRVTGVSFKLVVDDETKQALVERREGIDDEGNKEDSPGYYV